MSKTSFHILAVAMVVLVTLGPNGFAQTTAAHKSAWFMTSLTRAN
jgi:hypothetical protein